MTQPPSPTPRRSFLKLAGTLAITTAAGCQLETRVPQAGTTARADRDEGFDRSLLAAVAEAVLPSELGARGQEAAVAAFVTWVDGYEPVAEEMHGYGYADIRYLPADPAPQWRAQLTALDLLARRSLRTPFAELTVDQRRGLLTSALRAAPGDRLPAPLEATHVALALLAHWAASPDAWDLALGVRVQPGTCRVLGEANAAPQPITGRPA
jgi:hypothetical protein